MRNLMIACLMFCSIFAFAQQKELHTFYEDGSLKSAYSYSDENNYTVVNYYPSGTVMETGSFLNGNLNGTWISFSAKGIKTGEAVYVNGSREGEWKMFDDAGNVRYKINYAANRIVSANSYDSNGKLVAESHTH